ncbi:TonB family protein [Mesorhizobium sp. INR15]|nr:TonB family protein [Mesorhizobium sp. INR15]
MQDITPFPDTGAELPITPAEPLAPAQPSARNYKWQAAIVISGALHAAVAAAFLMSPPGTFDFKDTAQSEGTDRTGADVAGTTLDRESSALDVTLVPAPQPSKPRQAKPETPKSETAKSLPPIEPVQAAKQPKEQAPKPEAVKQPAPTPDILAESAPRPDNQSVVQKNAAPAQPAVQPESVEAPAAVAAELPVPSQRPNQAIAPAPEQASDADEKRGAADGKEQSAAAASKGKKEDEAGAAAEASYRNDVIKKLSRVNRGVPPSVQATARNNAVVTFVIGGKGNINELRILESSGSENFDQAVLGIVRKAAPFPPIPKKAGGSLVFTGAIGPF